MAIVKSKLLKKIFENYPNFLKKDLEKFFNIILEEIKISLKKGERVELRGFGIFDVKKRAARIARNPKNGSAVAVPEKNVPYFRMGKNMKDRLNK